MVNPYVDYYKNQAGSGLTAFEGYQYQRGHGWFGAVKGFLRPILGWLGKKALKTGVSVGADLLAGQKFQDALSTNLKRTGGEVLDEGYERGKKFLQTGSGRRRRRRRRKASTLNAIKSRKQRKRKPVKKRSSKKKRKSRSKNKFSNFF